ncbi:MULTISPECIES: hypothetical protein [Mycobacteroides]|uniref:Uncharacterized protein n=2 Tax=Mycobacteroides TaxID=670516 RepID=A0A7V8RWK6_9MYCO|nr:MULTISPECIES: hypothetical protein [Mycobacteroides]AMT69227.1 hypothetical protein ABG82_01455 [Mycobacteroides immunogenum]ANO02257.1 hypothetical protein BAB75_01455 [Mycobacteroides immunogenum]KIU40588.1 hypothetical protein TL11_10015 [Mycobacteroides immunogenum]KPG11255.1 hypothetical protein AN908_12815 [Mycobacteroides immunogenum]KPG12525.1 hypothetical protein AN909_06840 [Mycobacteroides immunogenum]
MGKWILVGLLGLSGLSLLSEYPLWGAVMLAAAGLIAFFSVRSSGGSRSYSMPTRPGQLSAARYDSREEISNAERDAARMVRAAQEGAEEQGQSALRAAMTFLSQETRWLA